MFKSDGAAHHQFLDLADGLRGVEALGAHVHAVHDGVAAEKAVGVFQVVQARARGFVAAVGDEAVGLQQAGGAHELVGVPPEARAARGAARAQDALVQAVELVALLGGLQALLLGRDAFRDEVGLDRVVLLEELRHVHDQVADHGQARQRLEHDGALERVHVGEARQAVLAVDVHRVGAADAFAAGAAERDGRVLRLQLDQGVEQHALMAVELDLDGLHVGLGVLVRIVAVDLKGALHGGVSWVLGGVSERADLGRHAVHGQGLEVHGLVGEAVASAVPQRVLHPLLVVAAQREVGVVGGVLVVVHRMRAAAFLAGGGRDHRRLGDLDEVVHFQRFHAGRVPHLGLVLQRDRAHALADGVHLHHAFVHAFLRAEHAGVLLHRCADVVGDVLGIDALAGFLQLVEARQRAVGAVGRQGLVLAAVLDHLDDVAAGGLAEHQQVEQRVRAQAVGAVHRHAGAFAHGVQAVHHLVVDVAVLDHDLAVDVGRDATHLVVDGGHDRDRLLRDVHVGEVDADLVHRGQALVDGLRAQVVELEQHVVLVGTAAAAFLDLLVHRAGDEVARRQVLQRGRVALHEALAVAVEQDGAFTAAALGQQHARAGHAGGVELPEFHVLQRDAGTCRHAQAVAGVDEGVGRCREDAARAAGGQQHGLGLELVELAGFQFDGGHADHVAGGIADQVQGHPLDEEVRLGLHVLLVERVQHGVAGAVGRGAGALHGLLAVVGGVAAEGALVDGAVRVAVERHAEVFQLIHHLGGLAAHELDGVLVAQPVGALDGVVEVVVPVVLAHVAERGRHAALRRHGVRAGGEDLGERGHVQARAGEFQRGTHAGAARADDDDVELARGDVRFGVAHCCVLFQSRGNRIRGARGSGCPSRHSRRARRS